MLTLLLLALPLMADGSQCGYTKAGCKYGWHDCDIRTASGSHGGRHHCRNCGNSF